MIATPELHPKTLDLLKEFEGKPRLKARLCEGGRYEVAYGVTYHLDDRPVLATDSITEDQVMPYTLYALAKEAAPVWAALTRPVTPAQAGALAVLAFNVGGGTVAKSIREQSFRAVNEGRYEDAAAAFGQYTGATSSGPSPTELAAGTAPKTGQVRQKDGSVKVFILYAKIGNTHRWVPPEYTHLTDKLFELGAQIEAQAKIIAEEAVSEEELERREEARARADALILEQRAAQAALNNIRGCKYFRRFRGLLRRHHAEGLLFLGHDWKEATKSDAISMALDLTWNAEKSRWEDKIVRQTEFTEVLEVARRYPRIDTVAPPIASQPDPPKPAAPVIPVEVEALPEISGNTVRNAPAGGIVVEAPARPAPEILPEPPLPKPVEKPVTASPPPPPKPVTIPPAQLPNDFDPNLGVKAMVYSRRFWGWVLIVLGRFSFVTDGSAHWASQAGGTVGQVANMVAADPLLLDAWTGMAVMFVGEGVRWWGEKKKTKVLV